MILDCVECGRSFIWSEGEQRFYHERNLSQPKRCQNCRPNRYTDQTASRYDSTNSPSQPSSTKTRWPAHLAQPQSPSPPPMLQTGPAGRRPSAFYPRAETPPPRPAQPQPRLVQRQTQPWWASPYAQFGGLSFGVVILGVAAAAWLLGVSAWVIIPAYLLIINIMTLFLFRYDKFIAGGSWTRAPEKILLGLAFFGGSLGAYWAMFKFPERHKTQKKWFQKAFWSIVALQLTGICAVALIWFSLR